MKKKFKIGDLVLYDDGIIWELLMFGFYDKDGIFLRMHYSPGNYSFSLSVFVKDDRYLTLISKGEFNEK